MTRGPVLVTCLLLLPHIMQAKVFLVKSVSKTENTDESTEGQDYSWIHDIQEKIHDSVHGAVAPIPLFDTLTKPLRRQVQKQHRKPVQNSSVKLVKPTGKKYSLLKNKKMENARRYRLMKRRSHGESAG